MRIGSFITPERVSRLAAAGGDYAELFVTRTVMVGDRDDFSSFAAQVATWATPPLAFSGLIPANLRLTGPDVDPREQNDYLDEMFWRIATITDGHPAMATVGSAGARDVPAGFDREHARDQLADFLRYAGAKARNVGVTLNFEHLHRGESNIFNRLAECGDFIRERDLGDIHLVADLYHLMMEDEPLSVIADYASLIVHAHVADTDRDAPGTGDYPFVDFFTALQRAGYRGDCSIEAFWTDFDHQVDAAVRTVKSSARSAGFSLLSPTDTPARKDES